MSLENISDEELQSMIDNHPEVNNAQRGVKDWGRDIAYGLAEGSPLGIGQSVGEFFGKQKPNEESLQRGSILPKSKKDLMNLGEYEFNPQYEAKGLKSPNPSAGGDMASLIAEILSPIGLFGSTAKGGKTLMDLGTKTNEIRKSIPLTQTAAGKMKQAPIEKYGHIQEHFYSPESSRDIMKLFEHPDLEPYQHHIAKLLDTPGLKSADEVQSILYNREKELGRKGDFTGKRVTELTKGKSREELLGNLGKHAGEKAPKEWERGQNAYRNYKTIRELPMNIASAIFSPIGHIIHKLLARSH